MLNVLRFKTTTPEADHALQEFLVTLDREVYRRLSGLVDNFEQRSRLWDEMMRLQVLNGSMPPAVALQHKTNKAEFDAELRALRGHIADLRRGVRDWINQITEKGSHGPS